MNNFSASIARNRSQTRITIHSNHFPQPHNNFYLGVSGGKIHIVESGCDLPLDMIANYKQVRYNNEGDVNNIKPIPQQIQKVLSGLPSNIGSLIEQKEQPNKSKNWIFVYLK